jgi:hypothetical protein
VETIFEDSSFGITSFLFFPSPPFCFVTDDSSADPSRFMELSPTPPRLKKMKSGARGG